MKMDKKLSVSPPGVCPMESARRASLNGGLGRSPQRCTGGESGGFKLKAFCPFAYKNGPKVKDLNENSRRVLRQTASRSHDQP